MVTLIARVTANSATGAIDWFGTSMGGLIGIRAGRCRLIRSAAGAQQQPDLDPAALQRIGEYIGRTCASEFCRRRKFVREVSASFGAHTDEQWHKLAADVLRRRRRRQVGAPLRHGAGRTTAEFHRRTGQGRQADAVGRLRCDPLPDLAGARRQFRPAVARETAADADRGPKPQLVEIPDTGHADLHQCRSDCDCTQVPGRIKQRATPWKLRLHVGKTIGRSGDPQFNGVPGRPGRRGDSTRTSSARPAEVLGHVDRLLAEAGSDRAASDVPDLHIADMAHFASMNEV